VRACDLLGYSGERFVQSSFKGKTFFKHIDNMAAAIPFADQPHTGRKPLAWLDFPNPDIVLDDDGIRFRHQKLLLGVDHRNPQQPARLWRQITKPLYLKVPGGGAEKKVAAGALWW
jgi:hypothetical protein